MRFSRRYAQADEADPHRPLSRLPIAAAAAVLAVAALSAGCGGRQSAPSTPPAHKPAPAPVASEHSTQIPRAPKVAVRAATPPPPRCTSSAFELRSPRVSYAALVVSPVEALRRAGGGAAVAQLNTLDINGLRTVVGVDGVKMGKTCRPSWYHVELAVLPNGTGGWLPAASVSVYRVRSRIVVSLSRRSLRLYRSGRVVLETAVGIGSPSTPTPTGRFYVNERYVLTSPDGPFGPDALGISAHSPTLAGSWTENGPIALHGTNEPWSIGQAVSHGCVHVPNAVMRRLFALAPDGTPVVIRD